MKRANIRMPFFDTITLNALVLMLVCACAALSQTTTAASSGQHSVTNLEDAAAVDEAYAFKKGTNEFGAWAGGAFNATTIFGGLHEDEAQGRKALLIGLRYGRVFAAGKRLAYEYTFDAIPLAEEFGTIVNVSASRATSNALAPMTTRENVYGAGLVPLGFKLNFGRRRVKPFANVNGGFLIFKKPVPLPDAGKFAYTGEAGTGVQFFTKRKRAVTVGFKFHHISNGNREGANRGLNMFMFYGGFSVFKK